MEIGSLLLFNVDIILISDSVVLTLGVIHDEKMDILIASPRNPEIYEMSSYFQVCLRYNNSPTNCKK